MIQCNAGHFYDESRHSACPYCGVPIDVGATAPLRTEPIRHDPLADSMKTIPMRPLEVEPKTAPVNAPPAGATRRLVREQLGMDPVVGWLVCLEGPERGRDYRIHSEKNFIGRDPSMDICIAGDETISRHKHATVAFEPKKRTFWLVPGEASGLVYLNGDVIYAPSQLKERDVIELGKTKLTLVAFVTESFAWQE